MNASSYNIISRDIQIDNKERMIHEEMATDAKSGENSISIYGLPHHQQREQSRTSISWERRLREIFGDMQTI